MGLNESYVMIRGNILMMKPLPTISQAYALSIQEERQREVNATMPFSGEHTAFHVNSNRGRVSFQRINADTEGGNRFVECKYCKKKGHTIKKCYKLQVFFMQISFLVRENELQFMFRMRIKEIMDQNLLHPMLQYYRVLD